jgi:hypothetical protein
MKNYGCIEPLLDGSGINYQLASKGILDKTCVLVNNQNASAATLGVKVHS